VPDDTNDRSRRAVLRTGLVAGTVAIAGCNGGGGGETDAENDDEAAEQEEETATEATTESGSTTAEDTDTQTEGDADTGGEDPVTELTTEFEEDFEDGDYTSDPEWEFDGERDDTEVGRAEIVEQSSPAGGSMSLELTDLTDTRVPGPSQFNLAEPMEGMDSSWTLTGLFSPGEITEDMTDRYNAVTFYWPPDGNFGNRAVVEFRFTALAEDDDEPKLRMRTQLQENREWSVEDTSASSVETDQWYRWELVHDGDGGYLGRRWPADGERSDGTELEVDFEAPDESVAFDLQVFSAVTGDDGSAAEAGERPYTVQHDFVRRTSQ